MSCFHVTAVRLAQSQMLTLNSAKSATTNNRDIFQFTTKNCDSQNYLCAETMAAEQLM